MRLLLAALILFASAPSYAAYTYRVVANAHTGNWTTPTNVYDDGSDDDYATATPGKNLTVTSTYGFPDLPSNVIATGNTINSVTCHVEWKISATTSISTLGVQLYRSTTAQGTETTEVCDNGSGSCSLTDHTNSQSVTSGFSVSDLQNADSWVYCQVRASRGNDNQSFTGSIDYVILEVTYSLPTPAGAPQVLEPNGSRSSPANPGDWTFTTVSTYDDINDADTPNDSDYMTSVVATTDPSIEHHDLENGTDPSVNTEHYIKFRASKATGTGGVGTVYLCQGTGTCGSGSNIASCPFGALTSSFADKSCLLTGTQADSITNYSDVWFRWDWAGGLSSLDASVSWGAFEIPGVSGGPKRRIIITGGD